MRRALLFPVATVLLTVAACDSGSDEDLRVDLRAGTALSYSVAYTTSGESAPSERFTRTDRVTGVGQTLGALRGLTVVESTERSQVNPPLTSFTRTWYRPSDDRLEEVAYEFVGTTSGGYGLRATAPDPTLPRLVRQALARRAATRPSGNSSPVRGPQMRTPARIVIEYPAETGRTWTHFAASEGSDLRSTREIIRTETVETPAGTFRCAVVRTRLFSGGTENSTDWVDWIGSVGLVQRRIVYRDQQATDDKGNPIGTLTTTQFEQLIAAE